MNFHDLIVAARVLRKSPIFVLTAVLTIALGIGASTAIFSVTNAVLLRPAAHSYPLTGDLVLFKPLEPNAYSAGCGPTLQLQHEPELSGRRSRKQDFGGAGFLNIRLLKAVCGLAIGIAKKRFIIA